ncbi:MAG: tRNA (adenosine(37)-N6)-threonylcarbamoyltransferase complex dimerization subunit type 1 TsaB [Clostridia bacterium]|nr:tRNA (adenosine(37)-N6)-threonylcarbamoyltransferase complex dimerization subunit type 1 TsaB [Clostridia bacterium]
MKILAIDTTAKTATAALTENEKLLALTVLNTPNTHSVTLLPMIDGLLRGAGLTLSDVDLLVCSAGPGSFTGVRIGAAAIKGLAFADGKTCIGVSALEALALNVTETDGIICPVMDARRNQLYNALFKYENGSLKRLTPDRVLTAAELASELSGAPETVHLTGDGAEIAKRALSEMKLSEPHEALRYHNAYNVALLGFRTYLAASEDEKKNFTAEKLSPVYLRASQAERERLERLEKENKS